MVDDTTKGGSGDFDDWLEEEPGPPSDPANPYAELASDDADEIAEWMAFTGGSPPSQPVQPEAHTQEPPVEAPVAEPDDEDETGEMELGDALELAQARESVSEPESESAPEPEPASVYEPEMADEPEPEPEPAPEPEIADEPGPLDEAVPEPGPVLEPVVDDAFNEAETVEIDAIELAAIAAAGESVGASEHEGDVAGYTTVPFDDTDDDLSGDEQSDDGYGDGVAAAAVAGAAIAAPFDIEAPNEVPVAPTTDQVEADTSWPLEEEAEDTGELEVVPIAPYGGFTADPEPETTEALPPESRELFDLSESDYLSTATTEHSDLAEAVALASVQDTEQVPIAAPIPGMTDTVVGFEDVVEAEGFRRVRARASGDLVARVITGVVLIAALGASLLWRPALALFALAVFVLGAGEFYTSLVRTGHKPIALFGFAGITGASVGAYFFGAVAIPSAFFLAIALLLLYYAVVPGKKDPLGNLALTITVMVWVGLGSFTMLIAVSESYRPLVLGTVITVAAMDIGQYFVGRSIGRTQLSPWVSPKKTVEGLIGGVFIALLIGALLHFVSPFELTSGLALGAVVAILVPLGDLAMSAAKRSLGLKDMGSVLPGHGGFLDRIDGLLFVIPAAWVIFLWAGIL